MQFFAPTFAALLLAVSATDSATAANLRQLKQVNSATVASDLLTAINKVRAAKGLEPLCLNSKLVAASQAQAADMAKGGFISPTGSSGSSPTSRAEAQGLDTPGVWELVGAGYSSVSNAMDQWLSSTNYDDYLLGDFEFLGAGYAYNKAQQYKSFWVLDFSEAGDGETCA